jgi:predicted RNase H-like nuclease
MSTVQERINENLAKLGIQLDLFSVTLSKLDEIINGTSKSGGLKERIAIAEEEIKKNKESFKTINDNITQLRNEMLVEVGNIAKSVKDSRPPGVNWTGVLQAVVTAIAIGVTGIIFWQIIAWLAANSPITGAT